MGGGIMSAPAARIAAAGPRYRLAPLGAAVAAAKRGARALHAVMWYMEGLLGADAYRNYLAYHRASGCPSAPMTEREFWRDKLDRQDRHPEGRCC